MKAASKPVKKKKVEKQWIVAIAAVVVSVLTLFVYFYQARVMMKQQHISVWPYLEWTTTLSDEQGFYLSVQNKGIGPAIVKSTDLRLDDKPLEARAMLKELLGTKADSLWIFGSVIDYRVIAPGEEIRLFHVKDNENVKVPDLMNDLKRIYYTVCYCSVYDDCWTSYGLVVKEDKFKGSF